MDKDIVFEERFLAKTQPHHYFTFDENNAFHPLDNTLHGDHRALDGTSDFSLWPTLTWLALILCGILVVGFFLCWYRRRSIS